MTGSYERKADIRRSAPCHNWGLRANGAETYANSIAYCFKENPNSAVRKPTLTVKAKQPNGVKPSTSVITSVITSAYVYVPFVLTPCDEDGYGDLTQGKRMTIRYPLRRADGGDDKDYDELLTDIRKNAHGWW